MPKIHKFIFFITITLLGSGCMMIRPGAVKSGKNLYESYFMGNTGVQYFIKPIHLKEKSNIIFETDFTFKYAQKIDDSAVMNFSIQHEENIYKKIDTLFLTNRSLIIKINNSKLLFNEKQNKYYVSRFSAKITQKDLRLFFADAKWKITLNQFNFIPSGKTIKNINKLNNYVFKLLD